MFSTVEIQSVNARISFERCIIDTFAKRLAYMYVEAATKSKQRAYDVVSRTLTKYGNHTRQMHELVN